MSINFNEYECCKSDNFTPGMKITNEEWFKYATKNHQ